MQGICDLAGVCSGCPWIEIPYKDQLTRKSVRFMRLWEAEKLPWRHLPFMEVSVREPWGGRDRVDMTIHGEDGTTHFGLYDMQRERILDIGRCPQMSAAVRPWFDWFREQLPPFQFGHVRLRVAPNGRFGVWLDFPKTLVRDLLREQSWLRRLLAVAHVEIGQRRETLVVRGEELQLAEPDWLAWFETYLPSGRAVPLYANVGSFTQPGFALNRILVTRVIRAARATAAAAWLELGSGIGNLTLPLAALGTRVLAVENDRRACTGLIRSAEEAGLAEAIRIKVANMHRFNPELVADLGGVDGVLADPPRSGLRAFLDNLDSQKPEARPRWFLYLSCYAPTLVSDVARLYGLGYRAARVELLDQFPQSPHAEWLCLLERGGPTP